MNTQTVPFVKRDGINWTSVITFTLFHAGAIAAFFFFTWPAFVTFLVLYWVSLSLGIGMGYHRLLTHRGYKVPKPLEYALAVCGSLALEGGPIPWVATHRVHHKHSDQEGDPHTPRDGKWWSHLVWMLVGDASNANIEDSARFAPDLMRDPFHVWLSKFHYIPITISAILLAFGGLPFVLWGLCMRVTLGYHATWMVNSLTHFSGKRRFATRDDSRNNALVAMVTFGEGWHNNHHAHPTSARHGLAWYEVDMTWMLISMLRKLGIATSVREASIEGQSS